MPCPRYARCVERSLLDTTTAEEPALTDDDRVERLQRLAERLRSPGGLDRETLAQIEELSGDDR